MRNPISTALKYAEFSGFDDIAKRLIESYRDIFAGTKPRSLGIHIGELDKGKATWWVSRTDKARCLAELLEIDQDELGIHENTGRHTFCLPVFKDFPPLDLIREDIWTIAEPRLASSTRTEQDSRYYTKPTLNIWQFAESATPHNGDIEWLHVPDEVEHQLLTRKLAAVSHHGIIERSSLQAAFQHDIVRVRQQQGLIVAIGECAQIADLQELAHLRHGAPALIISPHPLPAPTPEPQAISPEPPGLPDKSRIKHWKWTLLPNWRETLLQWIEQRNTKLDFLDTKYTRDRALGLLERLDPGQQLLTSVRDLLTLCQAVSESGSIELAKEARSDGNVEKLLSQLFGQETSAFDLVSPLTKARWERWDLPWTGELPQDHWMELSKHLCQWETLLARKVIIRSNNGYDFQQPILSRLILRAELMKRLLQGEPASWAPACFDNERRPLLDAALDALTIPDLSTVATKLDAPESTESIGATEALFAAIGRRLTRAKEEPQQSIPANLTRLADDAIKGMRWRNGLISPRSRPTDTPEEQLEWITVCWAWSLQTPPDMDILPANWNFPGWATDLPKVPDWLKNCGTTWHTWEQSPQQMDDFLCVVERWLDKSKVAAVENQSVVFNIALLSRASPDKWPASKHWWSGIIGYATAEQALLDHVKSHDEATKTSIALAWWPSLIEVKQDDCQRGAQAWRNLDLSPTRLSPAATSSVIDWVLQHVTKNAAPAIQVLDDDAVLFLAKNPGPLPVPLRKELLRRFLTRNLLSKLQPYQMPIFFTRFGAEPDIANELEAYLGFSSTFGLYAAQHLWTCSPDSAERLLTQKHPLTKDALRNLLLCSPGSAIHKAIGLLMEDRGLLTDDERVEWAYARLPNARQHAQDLMQLI